jgi:hypothetical protein
MKDETHLLEEWLYFEIPTEGFLEARSLQR